MSECDRWWQFWDEGDWVSLGRTKNYDRMGAQAGNP